MLALLATVALSPIELKIDLPDSVSSGARTEIVVRVANVSGQPVTLIEAQLPNLRLGMHLRSTVTLGDQTVDTDSIGPMMGQWFTHREIGPEPFFTLKPGESRELYRESFERVFVGPRPRGEISEVAKAPRMALPPGRYRWKMEYRLDRILEQTRRGDQVWRDGFHPIADLRLTPEAQRLFDRSWKGAIFAEATFLVRKAAL